MVFGGQLQLAILEEGSAPFFSATSPAKRSVHHTHYGAGDQPHSPVTSAACSSTSLVVPRTWWPRPAVPRATAFVASPGGGRIAASPGESRTPHRRGRVTTAFAEEGGWRPTASHRGTDALLFAKKALESVLWTFGEWQAERVKPFGPNEDRLKEAGRRTV